MSLSVPKNPYLGRHAAEKSPDLQLAGRIHVPSRAETWLIALFAGISVFGLSMAAQWYFYVYRGGHQDVRVFSASVAGVVTTLLVQRLMAASRDRRLANLRRFQIIAEMNHHIRNSLQTISYQRFAADAESAARLKDAVDRIQWVLEQVLPKVQEEGGKPRPPDSEPLRRTGTDS
jgi:signal transduction histidine kinase